MGFASLGMCIVIITGNIDLSIIGNVSMTTVITAVLMVKEVPTPLIVLIVLLSGMAVGLLNGIILSVWKIESFVVTMGMQVVCFGMAMLVSGNRTVIVPGASLAKYGFLTNLAQWKVTVIPGAVSYTHLAGVRHHPRRPFLRRYPLRALSRRETDGRRL